MPLQNRVTPQGEIIATSARGLFMGNRGGRLHDPETHTLGEKRWVNQRWICCALHFKERHRDVMGEGYTELFFLDEPTALAAGHRPCFECRKVAAESFAACWANAKGLSEPPKAPDMDKVLHQERLEPTRIFAEATTLPDGTAVLWHDQLCFTQSSTFLVWTETGYSQRFLKSHEQVRILTPPSIVEVLKHGYRPVWHPSALLREEAPMQGAL